MTDLSTTVEPKTDQLNADSLVSGPMTIRVTKVVGINDKQQPIAIYFDGDNGKPYKPGLSMRRALIEVWGKEGDSYVGKSMTLYRDKEVVFGGIKVGGIRISHMSHINDTITLPLTASKAVRKPFTVQPLRVTAPATAITNKIDPQAPDLGHGGTGAGNDFPIYNPKGALVQHFNTVDEWMNYFITNLPNISKLESVEALQKSNMSTFVSLNEKGFSIKVGEVKEAIANRKYDLQPQPADEEEQF